MRKITIVLMSMLFLLTTNLFAAGKLVSSHDKICTDQTATLTLTDVDPTDYDFRWEVGRGGVIVGGVSSPVINVKWNMSGEKPVTVKYKNAQGASMIAQVTVNVYTTPSVGGVSVEDDDLCVGDYITIVGDPRVNDYQTSTYYDNGVWTLNGYVIDPKEYKVKYADDGKYLRKEFKSSVDFCPGIQSNGVLITVKDAPIITSVLSNDQYDEVPEMNVNENLRIELKAQSVTSNITSVEWYLQNEKMPSNEISGSTLPGKSITSTLNHKVTAESFSKPIWAKVTNACGSTITEKTVYKNVQDVEAPPSSNLDDILQKAILDHFMISEAIDPVAPVEPFKYWESPVGNYEFWTANYEAYKNVSSLWFKRNADGSWEEAKSTTYGDVYEFKVVLSETYPAVWGHGVFTTSLGGAGYDDNRTILVDEGEYLYTFTNAADWIASGDSINLLDTAGVKYTNPNDLTPAYRGIGILSKEITGLGGLSLNNGIQPVAYAPRENFKIFGLRNVVIKIIPGPKPLDTNVDISPNNGAVENFTIDFNGHAPVSGIGSSTYGNVNYGLGIQHGGGSFIVKDITVKNVGMKTMRKGETYSVVLFQNFKENDGYRVIKNIKITDTELKGTDNSDVAAFGIGGASNLYLENLVSEATHGAGKVHDLMFFKSNVNDRAKGDAPLEMSGTTTMRGIVIDNFQSVGNQVSVACAYHKEGEYFEAKKDTFPSLINVSLTDNFRYIHISATNLDFYKEIPALDTNKIVYDLEEGVYIIRTEQGIYGQFGALKKFYEMLPLAQGAPLPNIKVVASNVNYNGQQYLGIPGFNVPDLNINADVNLIAVADLYDVANQDEFIPFIPGKSLQVLTGTNLVNFYNLDFASVADYSILDVVNMGGIRFGALYNTKIAKYLEGAYLAVHDKTVTGIGDIEGAASVAVFPNPVIDNVQIKADSEITLVNVFDANGKQLYMTKAAAATQLNIPATSWGAGLYIVVVETAQGGRSVHKIVKN